MRTRVTPQDIDVRELVGRTIEGLEELVRELTELRRLPPEPSDGPFEADLTQDPSGETGRVAVSTHLTRSAGAGRRLRAQRSRPHRDHDAAAAAWRAPPDRRGRMR